MRVIQIIFATALFISAAPAFAGHGHGKGGGACEAYEKTCKTDPSVTAATDRKAKHAAMKTCVTAAATADTANGQACLTAQSQHKGD